MSTNNIGAYDLLIYLLYVLILFHSIFAARRSYGFYSGICHRIRVGREGVRASGNAFGAS